MLSMSCSHTTSTPGELQRWLSSEIRRSHEIALLRGRLARELTQHVMNELSGVVNWDRSAGVVTTADAVNDHKR